MKSHYKAHQDITKPIKTAVLNREVCVFLIYRTVLSGDDFDMRVYFEKQILWIRMKKTNHSVLMPLANVLTLEYQDE